MTLHDIPLSQLEPSPLNARKVRNKDRVAQFAASIEAHGILQNLQVVETGKDKFQVVIGGTRLAALNLLLKQKKIAEDYPVPCLVRAANDPALREISLAENVIRENMHPADEFDAFKKLADEGQGSETIAARFGITPTIVKQRLKLAVVSPKLIAAYRKKEMTLEQLMAFTVSDDHKEQEKAWKELPDWSRDRGDGTGIRAALTKQHVGADNKLAQFVGITAYEQAGGEVLHDLFDERRSWLTDPALLNRLAAAKLEQAAAPLRNEGWKWVEGIVLNDGPRQDTQQYGRTNPTYARPEPAQQTEINTLQNETTTIVEKHGEYPEDEAAERRLEEINDRINELGIGKPIWTDKQKAVAGVIVSIGYDGKMAIEHGIVKSEDKAALRKLNNDAEQENAANNGGNAPAKKKGGLPATLLAELTSHKTAAAQLVLATNADVALLAVTHAIVLQQLYPVMTSQHSSLGISSHGPTYPMAAREVVEKSPAARKLAVLIKSWQKKLPTQPEELWGWLAKQKPATVNALLALGTALTVDMVQVNGAEAKPVSDELAKAMNLDMADHWEATAENYFTRVSRKHLLNELGDNIEPSTHKKIESMKRDEAAKTIVTELKGKRWVPDVLKIT